ncbi:MAG: aminotransferase class V-fold PLP-dependent enzyme [Bryobacteraceae bacterium]
MNRRAAIASLFALPAAAVRFDAPKLPPLALAARDSEKYWSRIRAEQFLLPKWRAFLNNGSLGIAPRPVVAAVADYLAQGAAMTIPNGEYPRWGYETLDAHRQEMAAYLGCAKDDLAFTHNATEALSTIAAGIDLEAGDEVLMTDQEHGSGKAGWLMRQARHGIRVREVPIPLPPRDPEQLADVMISAIGPRTRVLFFSGITTMTGLVMPVRQICDAARAKGVITVVDGAHMNGQIACRLDELGCDYYAGSPHKWMFAPAGCGILWGRSEMLDRLWPSIVTGGWDNRERKAARFMMVGTNNRAIFEGMIAGVRFANAVGPERIFDRAHALARTVRERAAQLPYLELLTPADDRMYGALVSFRLKNIDPPKLFRKCDERKIWILKNQRMRISTHIHTRPSDLDAFFETLAEVAAG